MCCRSSYQALDHSWSLYPEVLHRLEDVGQTLDQQSLQHDVESNEDTSTSNTVAEEERGQSLITAELKLRSVTVVPNLQIADSN